MAVAVAGSKDGRGGLISWPAGHRTATPPRHRGAGHDPVQQLRAGEHAGHARPRMGARPDEIQASSCPRSRCAAGTTRSGSGSARTGTRCRGGRRAASRNRAASRCALTMCSRRSGQSSVLERGEDGVGVTVLHRVPSRSRPADSARARGRKNIRSRAAPGSGRCASARADRARNRRRDLRLKMSSSNSW